MSLAEDYSDSFLEQLNQTCGYIDNIPVASCIIDLNENIILKCNSFFADLIGIKQLCLIDLKKFTDFEFSSIIKQISANKENIFCTNTEIILIKNISGDKIHANINLKLLRNFKNKIVLAIFNKIPLNLSDSKLNDNYFIESNKFIKYLFEDLPVLFYAMDLTTFDLLYVNKYTSTILNECDYSNYHKKLKITEYEKHRSNDENYTYEKSIDGIWYKMADYNLWWFKERKVKISIGINISQLKVKEEEMLLETNVDSMTGAYSRIVAVNSIQNLINKTKIESYKFSVCYFDINNLKLVNERYGYKCGDEYIKIISDIVKNTIRKTDVFSRSSDDEFILVLKDCSSDLVDTMMKSIDVKLKELSETKNFIQKNSISYGIVEVDENNNDIDDADDIIDIAVKKMSEMKEQFNNYE